MEVLHTILVGIAKYMLQTFMPRLTNRMKEEVLAHVNAFPRSGLLTKMFGNECRYYNSFVGRDFKGWAQMSIFILSSYLSSEERKVLSKVRYIGNCLIQPIISKCFELHIALISPAFCAERYVLFFFKHY